MANPLPPNEATRTRVRDALSCWLPVVACLAILFAILKPVFDQARVSALSEIFMTHTKVLRLALEEYCADNGDRFPPAMDSALSMKPMIRGYVTRRMQADDERVYRSANPASQEILANWHLAGRTKSTVAKPEETALFYDSAAWPDGGWVGGKRQVCMLNGHVPNFTSVEVDAAMRERGGVFPAKGPPSMRKPGATP